MDGLCLSYGYVGGEKNKVTMKNVSLDQVSGKEMVEQTVAKCILLTYISSLTYMLIPIDILD